MESPVSIIYTLSQPELKLTLYAFEDFTLSGFINVNIPSGACEGMAVYSCYEVSDKWNYLTNGA